MSRALGCEWGVLKRTGQTEQLECRRTSRARGSTDLPFAVSQSLSQPLPLLPQMEHLVHYTLDLLECRRITGLITQNPGNLSSLAGTTVGPLEISLL